MAKSKYRGKVNKTVDKNAGGYNFIDPIKKKKIKQKNGRKAHCG